jgi:hypothetical protein
MPNHCENDLYVSCLKDDYSVQLTGFIAKVCTMDEEGVEKIDFEKIIRYPTKFKILDDKHNKWFKEHPGDYTNAPKDGYNSGGYDWCINNWGTKWNAYNARFEDEGDRLIFNFNTAWAPPEPIIRKLIEMFPGLSFTHEYYEAGACFSGGMTGEEGKVTHTWSSEYYGNRGG